MISKIYVVGGQIRLQRCTLYAHSCAIVEHHHIVPESWWEKAGLIINGPLATVCPSCHLNTHAAIDGIILGRDISRIPPRCQALARQAFDLAAEWPSMKPELTL